MKPFLSVFGTGALLALHLSAADHSSSAANTIIVTTKYITALADEARTNAPMLRAARARSDASAHNANAVRVWEDPTFKLGALTASPRGFRESEEGNLVYGLDQKLPLWGKAELARAAARAETSVAQLNAEFQFQQLRRDLTRNLFTAALADRMVETGERDLELIETLAAIAEQRYRAGQGSQVEVLRAQNERAKRANALLTERSQREHSRVTLNRLLGRPTHAPWPAFDLPPPASPVMFDDRLIALASRGEPRLKVLRQEIDQTAANVAVTRRRSLPDVAVGVEGRQYSGDAGFREGLLTLSVNLPWFNRERYRSERQREEARWQASREDAADFELGIRQEVHHLTVEMDAARRAAILYRDEIIPRGEQALASAQAAWTTGRGMFNDVMEARRMLLEGRLEFSRATSEQHILRSDLAIICGLNASEELEKIGATNNFEAKTAPKH